MKKKIKEIQDYFIAKMLANDFRVIKMSEYTMNILIDDEYSFYIWLSNQPENRKPYHSQGNYFIELNFTKAQCVKLHSVLRKEIMRFQKEVLLKEKKKKFEQLKKELGYN
ncbi:hypothetical protein LCGC14_2009230 [marine sediment metagenome]|uniref:Uncharacterized protein n=1 Tax=marine sediment metagenome TaxID=412755 RepID=A0A0F9HXW9_9ZZZZ